MGHPAMLLAVPHTLAAAICTTIINDGGPGWLHLPVLLSSETLSSSSRPADSLLLLMGRKRLEARAAH